MMQMPLLSYPHFSQFLQLQQQQQIQQHYSRNFLPTVHEQTSLGMLSHRSGTSCSEASTGSPSPSPSPPLSFNDSYSSIKSAQVSSKSAKSFTIDAILGLRDREINREHLNNIIPNSFHPRLNLRLAGSRVELPNSYTDSLDINSTRLDIGTRRIGVTRLSSASREVLGLQLPTDLSTSAGVSSSGGEINRRDLHHQISTYQNNNSCQRLSEKSTSDASKKCGGKSKRVRTIFTPEQLERLEAEFERQQYMVGPERLYLAHTLQLTEAQVKVWFQNRRIKWRKQHLEIQQQRLAAIKQQQQRSEAGDSDDESVDSNNYSFSTDTNDNAASGFFKSMENISDLENVNLTQYSVANAEDVGLYSGENLSEPVKSETPSEIP